MKKLIFVTLILTALGFTAWYCYNLLLSPVNPALATPTSFVVERGATVTKVGTRLREQGLIRHELAFRLAVYLEQVDNNVQAGDYQLAPNMSARAIVKTLTHGVEEGVKLTIPEGFRLEQIAELAESKLKVNYRDVVDAARASEGYLFPDTYAFNETTTATELIAKLRDTWDAKVATLPRVPTTDEVILASILERETLTDSEKPIVAGILHKRLKEGWPLEVDATIQYMLGKRGAWWPIPLLDDRKIKSPYNTYLNAGLPPSPICNPGLVSLRAVEEPVESPYYFYLHDKSGNIHYASTNAEHESNIEKYIK